MSLTKQDIDALWDAHRSRISGSVAMNREDTYLAAGLSATGERKPERVRCWLWSNLDGVPFHMAFADPRPLTRVEDDERLIPGYFIPDGDADAR